MRTTVIPAQITTVEDKIAGSLSLTQIMILMIPVFFATLIFAIIPPTMHISMLKILPVLFILVICLLLTLRIKGKIVGSWLIVILSYNARPKYYVFNKNDAYLRDSVKVYEKPQQEMVRKEVTKELMLPAEKFGLNELKEMETFMANPNYTFSLKPGKNGALYVVISEVKNRIPIE